MLQSAISMCKIYLVQWITSTSFTAYTETYQEMTIVELTTKSQGIKSITDDASPKK